MAQELQIMLGVIVEFLREEEEEMELVDELANPNILEDLVVNRHIRLTNHIRRDNRLCSKYCK